MPRLEDDRLLLGLGTYIDDFDPGQCWHAVFFRSQVSSGLVASMDVTKALLMPGVKGIFKGEDFAGLKMPAFNALLSPSKTLEFAVLTSEKISYVGEPLAVVIAQTHVEAQNACEAIQLSLQRDPSYDAEKTEEALFSSIFKTQAVLDEKVQSTVAVELHQPRVVALTLETRSALARYVEETYSFHISLGSQTPSRAQSDFAKILDVPLSKVRVSMLNVGGAFGFKSSLYPEELMLALCCQALKKTIKWVSSRSEDFLSGMHGRGSELSGQLKLSSSGKILELQARVSFDLGAWLPFSAVVPMRNACRILPGPYHVPLVDIQGRAHLSHKAPVNIYRGAGRPEAAILMETLMEKAAKSLKIDSVDFRLKHLVASEEMPYRTPTGETLDSGHYSKILLKACELFAYEEERQLQLARRLRGECVGIGIGFYIEPCGLGWESASVEWLKDGTVSVYCGSPAQGQGHETSYANIVAQELHCSVSNIKVNLGDTDFGPPGLGTLASRSIAIGGSAIVKACREVLRLKDSGQALPIVAHEIFNSEEAWGYGCVIARLAIDIDTGKPSIERLVYVDDAGHQVDPELVKDQLLGGCAQGIGQAMMEHMVFDSHGQLLTGSLMDYAIPRADDIPYIQIHSECTPSPHNLLGAKGVGEAGCIGVPAALLNAARDALQLSVQEDIDFPLTSEKLWSFLRRSKGEEQR